MLFAFGLESELGHANAPLEVILAVGVSGGLALCLATHIAIRLQTSAGWGHGRHGQHASSPRRVRRAMALAGYRLIRTHDVVRGYWFGVFAVGSDDTGA